MQPRADSPWASENGLPSGLSTESETGFFYQIGEWKFCSRPGQRRTADP